VSLKISGEIEEIENLVRFFVWKPDVEFDCNLPLKCQMEKVGSVKINQLELLEKVVKVHLLRRQRIQKDPDEIQSENKQLLYFNS
jgi:hypothetical protein